MDPCGRPEKAGDFWFRRFKSALLLISKHCGGFSVHRILYLIPHDIWPSPRPVTLSREKCRENYRGERKEFRLATKCREKCRDHGFCTSYLVEEPAPSLRSNLSSTNRLKMALRLPRIKSHLFGILLPRNRDFGSWKAQLLFSSSFKTSTRRFSTHPPPPPHAGKWSGSDKVRRTHIRHRQAIWVAAEPRVLIPKPRPSTSFVPLKAN